MRVVEIERLRKLAGEDMTVFMSDLPIEPLLADIHSVLNQSRRLVLAAPPGAGKTTRVPLALAGLIDGFQSPPGKVLVLEPRRIAARMAAQRMAGTIGEKLGGRVGLSTRIERRVGKDTRIEVITDGLFTRRLLKDPELTGVSVVIFDEVHERGLNSDIGLALAMEVQDALRDDPCLLAMSATLDTDKFAARLSAPAIESEGRQYPVETRYLGRTRDRLEDQMAQAIERAIRETDGSVLAFLPGAGEIRRTAERLTLGPDILVAPLYGALSPQAQDRAIQPARPGQRKVVLATDIAESALTIEGVSVVVDSGKARRPEYDTQGNSARLVTVTAARANVDQRRGRAGRLGPGVCYRLWDEAETLGLVATPTPEILLSDLSGLVLTLAEWGETDPSRLSWLDAPPDGRLDAARRRLLDLGAIDEAGTLTGKGRAMSRLPMPPQMSALVVSANNPAEKAMAARIAALAGERGVGGNSEDLRVRLARFDGETSSRAAALRRQAERWSDGAVPSGDPARILAQAWPGQIARRRKPGSHAYLLASGRAGQLDEISTLAKSDWLVVVELIGAAKGGRIVLAVAIDEKTVLEIAEIETREEARFDPVTARFKARRVKAIGAIILSETPLPKPDIGTVRTAFIDHVVQDGFAPTGLDEPVRQFLARTALLRSVSGEDWPEFSAAALQASAAEWLTPALTSKPFQLPSPGQVIAALKTLLSWQQASALDTLAPLEVALPSGRKARINWLDDRAPLVEARVQELYGATRHIHVAQGRVPVTIQMLSPGRKPVATTQDLPGFWAGGYRDMAKDMRGRYPKHDWPDDPASAKPHEGKTKARLAKG